MHEKVIFQIYRIQNGKILNLEKEEEEESFGMVEGLRYINFVGCLGPPRNRA